MKKSEIITTITSMDASIVRNIASMIYYQYVHLNDDYTYDWNNEALERAMCINLAMLLLNLKRFA